MTRSPWARMLPVALLGVDLYRLTGRQSYLEQSERTVSWLESHLLDRSTVLYDDTLHLRDHRVVRSQATYAYDEGIMITVLAALSQVVRRGIHSLAQLPWRSAPWPISTPAEALLASRDST